MSPALVVTLWRQRAVSPIRMVLVAMWTGFPLLLTAFMPGAGLSVIGNSQMLVLTLGAGMIGQDVSSGVLQLVLARPVRRTDYLLSRWLAVAAAGSALSLLQVGLACGILAARGAAPPAGDTLLFIAGRILECFGLAAVLALLSSLAGGLGDLGLYVLSYLGAGLIQWIGQLQGWSWLDRLGGEIVASLLPAIDLPRLVDWSRMSWFPIVSYASTVALCLALAVLVMNRKELSYASH